MPLAPVARAPVLTNLLSVMAMLAAVVPPLEFTVLPVRVIAPVAEMVPLLVSVLLVMLRVLAEAKVPVLARVLSVTVMADAAAPAWVVSEALETVNWPVPVKLTAPLVSTMPPGILTLPPPLIAPTLRM